MAKTLRFTAFILSYVILNCIFLEFSHYFLIFIYQMINELTEEIVKIIIECSPS